jgi:deazaflavin-dependent oxidoreductase (nitroreductase family)
VSTAVLAPGRSLRVVDRRRVSTLLSTRLFNPLVKAATNAGLTVPGIAILETTGRKSGRPRRTPVGRSLDGDTCWIVAEHGRNAGYVRNIQADPSVRIKIGRRWRTGTAHVMPDDDPRAGVERRSGGDLTSTGRATIAAVRIRLTTGPSGSGKRIQNASSGGSSANARIAPAAVSGSLAVPARTRKRERRPAHGLVGAAW